MKISACFIPVTLAAGLVFLSACDSKPEAAPATAPASTNTGLPGPSATPGTPLPEASPLPAEAAAAPDAAVPASPALENFKQEMIALKAFMDEQSEQKDTVSGFAALKQLIARAKSVKTAGLPDDLREAYGGMTIVMSKLEAELDSLPFPVEKMEEYFAAQAANNPAALEALQPKMELFQKNMENIGQEGRIAAAHLRTVSQKYGIEGIDLGN